MRWRQLLLVVSNHFIFQWSLIAHFVSKFSGYVCEWSRAKVIVKSNYEELLISPLHNLFLFLICPSLSFFVFFLFSSFLILLLLNFSHVVPPFHLLEHLSSSQWKHQCRYRLLQNATMPKRSTMTASNQVVHRKILADPSLHNECTELWDNYITCVSTALASHKIKPMLDKAREDQPFEELKK